MILPIALHMLEVAMCWVFGHERVEYPRLNYTVCTRCTRKWRYPAPQLGEFYD